MEPVTLRTARLELSLPEAGDVDALYAACQDADIQRFTPVPSPYRRSDAEAFVERVPQDWKSGIHLTWVIREGERLVGTIGFYRIDGKGSGEIGYWISPDARGGGQLREAARAVIDWGFAPDGLGLVRIEWRAVAGNIASARAARALGFRYEGLLRQALVGPRGRDDGWIAGLLVADDRTPQPWPVLEA
ncbi:GNAT family N-acetyltransferase [Microbacterium sp. NEAU-LLC]|uniref:GNAT family N-acetyltransferase n=1 Tax=Microbacterium helvum TaxID=2773713 RepID=A0ABR8NMM8_9MICO|nr:GNAT family N-acetyltransferase [Microbacterium helvum]MBD3941920.1 GNAT family N-acetyltransferase [Microbacterium helvum]